MMTMRAVGVRGLIPARAGKTLYRWTSLAGARGSSPLARGKPQLSARFVEWLGSSPLARGKRGGGLCRVLCVGLIPARAGKTDEPLTGVNNARAHPRSRGENASDFHDMGS